MAKTDTRQSYRPEVINRRSLLTGAAAMAAVSTIPKVTAAEAVPASVQPVALRSEARAPKVCVGTARRLLEIRRRNELRQAGQLPLLSITKELRRMKQKGGVGGFSPI